MLSGWKGSGKDFIADIIVKNNKYKKIAFATKVKDEVSEFYNIDRNLFDSQDGKKLKYDDSTTYRDLLIKYGEIKRNQDIHHWSKNVYNDILKSDEDSKGFTKL